MSDNKVVIVLVNYNGHNDTIECLESLKKIKYTNYSIIVVDNSSSELSIEFIEAWARGQVKSIKTNYKDIVYPLSKSVEKIHIINEGDELLELNELTIIKAENRGFAAANNVALRAIENKNYEYVWLLNNDCIVTRDALDVLVKDINNRTQDVGILGATLYDYYQPDVIQSIGGVLNKFFGTVKQLNEISSIKLLDYPVGASMLVKRKFIEDVGGLNEDFFLYYEEVDWVMRGMKKGYNFGVNEEKLIFHKEGASTKGDNRKVASKSEVSDLSSLKSRLIFMKSHFPRRILLVKLGFVIVLFNRIRRRRFDLLPKIIRILFDA
ncbi:glycosyltransferase family 2 protein [Plebeiibacterium sediminum]|uniref:Glycosyltransferase family 2 protein n=1 Tax=Plebeiibacterium sediminum TaxID=2992112 RepID=A0AAE3M4M5_9BACT|nr:glycosyltransferase family 2 protein [Plebeiobacterium sediminum]MCW3786762.1 glycosyltransferase family 2 protein [Plebeiobacterium sediminum]